MTSCRKSRVRECEWGRSHSPFLHFHDEFVRNGHLFYILGAERIVEEHNVVGIRPCVYPLFIFHRQEGKVSVPTRSCEKLHFIIGHLLQALFLVFSLSGAQDLKINRQLTHVTPQTEPLRSKQPTRAFPSLLFPTHSAFTYFHLFAELTSGPIACEHWIPELHPQRF